MKILYKFPSRSRPEKFFNSLDNIYANAKHDNYVILATLDEIDHTMNTEDVRKKMESYDKLIPVFGDSKNKIDAVNRDMDKVTDWDVLIVMSDDMVFIQEGFDKTIINSFRTINPHKTFNLDQLIHFPDQNQGRNCMTMHICGRDYYNRDNFIYNPQFQSLWSDIVAQELGQVRRCYKYVNERIFNHLHPSFKQCEYDEQYKKTESWEVRQHDYDVYLKLKKEYDPENNFPIRGI